MSEGMDVIKSLTLHLTKKVNKHAIKWTFESVSNLHTVFGRQPWTLPLLDAVRSRSPEDGRSGSERARPLALSAVAASSSPPHCRV